MPKKGQKLKHHTGDLKKAAVSDVLKRGLGLRETARKFGVTHKMVSYWIKIYLKRGDDALYRPYSKKHLRETIPVNEVKVDKTIYPVLKVQPSLKEGPTQSERNLPKEIVTELKRLRMENTYLKKLNALVQEKKKSKTVTELK